MSGTSAGDPVILRAEQLRRVLAESGAELTGFTADLLREARALRAAVLEREEGDGHESGE